MNVVCLWSSTVAAHFLNSSGYGFLLIHSTDDSENPYRKTFKSRTKQANYRINQDLNAENSEKKKTQESGRITQRYKTMHTIF